MTLTHDRRTELLAGCPLFKGLDAAGLATLAELATPVDFPPGHVIARQGDIGTGFFVIVSGTVRVVRDGEVVARLGPGDFFGELAALDWGAGYGHARSATVTAVEPLRLLALAPAHLNLLMAESPPIDERISSAVRDRLTRT